MPVFLMCSRVEDQVAGDGLLNEVHHPEKQFKEIVFWLMGLVNLTDWAIIPDACMAQPTLPIASCDLHPQFSLPIFSQTKISISRIGKCVQITPTVIRNTSDSITGSILTAKSRD